jgi:DNA-binding response OmpR family regulator
MAKRIVIADDDVELAQNLSIFLEKAGYEVERRDNLANIDEDLLADTPDLLVLDVMFPRNASGGFNAARLIRGKKQLANLPIILLTGVNQECPVGFSTEDIDPDWMPVQDFVEKPFQPEEIIAKIEKMLNANPQQ